MMDRSPQYALHVPPRRWPLPIRLLIPCLVGVLLTCLIYWENWHREAGNTFFKSLVDDYGWQFRTSQPIAEVVLSFGT